MLSDRLKWAKWPIWCYGILASLVRNRRWLSRGMINWAAMGDPNASLPTPQPVFYRPMFGAMGKTLQDTCVTFVSQAALDDGVKEKAG